MISSRSVIAIWECVAVKMDVAEHAMVYLAILQKGGSLTLGPAGRLYQRHHCVILQEGITFLPIWLVRDGPRKHPQKLVSSVARTPRDVNISTVTLMGVVTSPQERKE